MKRYHLLLIAFLLIAIGGMCYGLKETLTHHYGAFAAHFPEANPLWWNPAESWRNKYEDGDPANGAAFPGSTTVLVFLTDAYHLFGDADRWFTRIGFVLAAFSALDTALLADRVQFFWHVALRMAVGWIVWSVGFHLVYTFVF